MSHAFYRHVTTVLLKDGVPVAFVARMVPTGITPVELAHQRALMPRLAPSDAAAFKDDIGAARTELAPPFELWT